MSYREDVAAVVEARREEIESDLAKARQLRDDLSISLADAERRVAAFESLLAMATPAPTDLRKEKMTLHAAMRKVLEVAPNRMMRAANLAAEIERRGLYRMQDGRPVEKQQIHARVGHYPDDFGREGTSIKLL